MTKNAACNSNQPHATGLTKGISDSFLTADFFSSLSCVWEQSTNWWFRLLCEPPNLDSSSEFFSVLAGKYLHWVITATCNPFSTSPGMEVFQFPQTFFNLSVRVENASAVSFVLNALNIVLKWLPIIRSSVRCKSPKHCIQLSFSVCACSQECLLHQSQILSIFSPD